MNIEVLAPVGSYKIVDEVLGSNCDAIYLGGIEFNMRMHSKLLNFKNEEIAKTVVKAHALGKKVYVTVNVWFSDDETQMLEDYLIFLDEIGVDAIIVQDLGVIETLRRLNLNLEIHASVMMNVHNSTEAKALEDELGINRFVLSREMPLDEVKKVREEINSEIEYFVSGDMCSVNGGICYASAIMFNKSANKGQCFKMCRWNYDMKHGGNVYESGYYLAAKDMDMLSHVDKLIEAGVNSLKIEGRRKKIEDTLDLINTYGKAVDKYKTNEYIGSDFAGSMDHMYPRSTSTSYAFGNPGLDYINSKNEGNPDALKIFSVKGRELTTTNRKVDNAKKVLSNNNDATSVSVKADNIKAANYGLNSKVDNVYLSIESFGNVMTVDEIQTIIDNKGNTKVFLSLPIMQSPASKIIEDEYMSKLTNLDGVEVTDYGQLVKYRDDYQIKTSFTFNVMNRQSANLLTKAGASSVMASIEATPKELESLKTNQVGNLDIFAFGRLTTMYSDLNFYDNLDQKQIVGKEDNKNFSNDVMVLKNGTGQENPILLDNYNKSHILTATILNYLPLFDQIKGNNLVIDTRAVTEEEYTLAIDTVTNLINGTSVDNQITSNKNDKYFLGSLNHTVKGAKYVIVK